MSQHLGPNPLAKLTFKLNLITILGVSNIIYRHSYNTQPTQQVSLLIIVWIKLPTH